MPCDSTMLLEICNIVPTKLTGEELRIAKETNEGTVNEQTTELETLKSLRDRMIQLKQELANSWTKFMTLTSNITIKIPRHTLKH